MSYKIFESYKYVDTQVFHEVGSEKIKTDGMRVKNNTA